MVNQEKIHRKHKSINLEESENYIDQLTNFLKFSQNKQEAWEELIELTTDKDSQVRLKSTYFIGYAFSQVPDKQKAWEIIIKLTKDENRWVRREATKKLGYAFSQVPDKQKAWEDLHKLISDEDEMIRWGVAEAIGYSFSQVPDKQKAWEDLIKLNGDNDAGVRWGAAKKLGSAFSHVPDKQKAWEDLIKLTSDKDSEVREGAAYALESSILLTPDKMKVWEDVIKLISNGNNWMRWRVAEVLEVAFLQIPDKQKPLEDLHVLTKNENRLVREKIAEASISTFSQAPDKQEAWEDLIRLTSDEEKKVQEKAIESLGYVFQYVPEKKRAWKDLIKLISDEFTSYDEGWIQEKVIVALGSAFSQVPDKQEAWKDLIKLTSIKNFFVQRKATMLLGYAFSEVPDKKQAWEDLHRLTSDEDSNVQGTAYHSLGRISIYKASQSESEEAYIEELENAITFFEKGANESIYWNPSRFCLPLYRSFYTIISAKKREVKDEVEKYLSEAKSEIGRSENKKLLFETVENLANALKEVQNLENMDLAAKKGELDFYRKYCEQASELMQNTEKTAPSATKVMRIGSRILDRKLKSLLEEIQEKAKTACRESQGTDTEEIACAVSREVQKWEMGTEEEMMQKIENLIFILKSKIQNSPENKFIFDKIEEIRHERNITKQYETVALIIGAIPSQASSEKPKIREELVITTGVQLAGTGAQHVVTIPLQDISYSDLLEDLGKIMGKGRIKFSDIPGKLAEKLKGCLGKNEMDHILGEGYLEISTESIPSKK